MFWRTDPNWRESFGYRFKWTPDHLTPEQLRPMIFTYDELGAKALDRLDEISPPTSAANRDKGANGHFHRDLYALIRDNADSDEVLGKFWEQVNTVPEWVDWKQLERGQQVFLRYSGPTIIAVSSTYSSGDLYSFGCFFSFFLSSLFSFFLSFFLTLRLAHFSSSPRGHGWTPRSRDSFSDRRLWCESSTAKITRDISTCTSCN
jgi:hypothetical protein